LGQVRGRGKTGSRAFARVQRGLVLRATPVVKAPTEGVDQDLAAMGGGSVRIGQFDAEFRFVLGKVRHGYISPYW